MVGWGKQPPHLLKKDSTKSPRSPTPSLALVRASGPGLSHLQPKECSCTEKALSHCTAKPRAGEHTYFSPCLSKEIKSVTQPVLSNYPVKASKHTQSTQGTPLPLLALVAKTAGVPELHGTIIIIKTVLSKQNPRALQGQQNKTQSQSSCEKGLFNWPGAYT